MTQNKDTQTTKCCAVDDGFAYTKVACDRGDKNGLKTETEPTHISSGAHSIATFSGDSASKIYETDEGAFTVGYAMDQQDTRFDSYPWSPMNRVMVHHILRKIGVKPGERASIAASTPMEIFFSATKEEREAMRKRKQENLQKQVSLIGEAESIIIDEVRILPEAASAYIDLIIDDNGNDREGYISPPSVAIVDIGGRTTDVAVMLGGNNIDMSHSGTEDVGVLNLINSVGECIANVVRKNSKTGALSLKIPLSMSESALNNFLKHGVTKIMLQGREYDIGDELNRIVNGFVHSLYSMVERRIQGISVQMDSIVLVGGGGALLETAFKQAHPNIMIPEAPQFANVRGMYKYLKYLTK